MKFPNVGWAAAERRIPHYKLASMIGCSEARLSRCLAGRSGFTAEERAGIAKALDYPVDWLFHEPTPPPPLSEVNPVRSKQAAKEERLDEGFETI